MNAGIGARLKRIAKVLATLVVIELCLPGGTLIVTLSPSPAPALTVTPLTIRSNRPGSSAGHSCFSTVSVAGTGATGTATGATPGEAVEGAIDAATQTAVPASVPPSALAKSAPPPPRAVTTAFAANRTVVLLFVRNGGIDDRIVARDVDRLDSLQGVATFVVPANRIARYAAITEGVAVDRVPALVVVRPKRLGHGIPTASVHYGFQRPESVVQAVIDAGYKGPTVDYHP
jgi:hypothetical protein